jgi:ketosteroid isomerase-like protein
MSQEPLEIVRRLAERWNAGDMQGVLDLYSDDVVVQTGPHWPERHVTEGKAAVRESMDEWLSVWESIEIETDDVEAYGDRVVAHGAWVSKGRASGVDGRMPIDIMLTVRGGKIARVDWFADHASAVAAARGA